MVARPSFESPGRLPEQGQPCRRSPCWNQVKSGVGSATCNHLAVGDPAKLLSGSDFVISWVAPGDPLNQLAAEETRYKVRDQLLRITWVPTWLATWVKPGWNLSETWPSLHSAVLGALAACHMEQVSVGNDRFQDCAANWVNPSSEYPWIVIRVSATWHSCC